MALMILATMLVPVGDSMSKYLTGVITPFEIVFWRFLFQSIVLLVAMRAFRQSLRPAALPLLVLGGFLAASTLVTLVGAFAVMPIATAIAIFFVEPLLLTVFSALFLGEKTGWRRYLAVAVGLLGALVVVRPNWATFGWPAILPLASAAAFAGNMIVARHLKGRMSGLGAQFWITVFAVVLLGAGLFAASLLGLFTWRTSTAPYWVFGYLPVMGTLSAFTYFLFFEAFRRTPASTLAPFQYLEIVGATAMGYIVFGDFPDLVTWLGTSVILASGIYVFHRERQASRADEAMARGVQT